MSVRGFLRREPSQPAANRHAATISPRKPASESAALRAELESAREEIARLIIQNGNAEREIRGLRRAVDARDTFIANAGVELRNPMAAVAIGVSNLLFQVKRAGEVAPWVGERLDSIDRRVRDFVRRSTTLLDVSRLAAGQLALHREEGELGDLVRWAMGEIAPEASRAGCDLRLATEGDVVGSWDRAAVGQVVLQLLSNAVRFGAGAPVDLSVCGNEHTGVVRVQDRGSGISDADRARIFDSFETAIAGRARAGFGLGLWIARQLVQAHGGEMAVDAEPQVGSVFTVTLPKGQRATSP